VDHHFVPQFYLRSFCDPAVPEGQQPWLWVADLKERTVERRAPKNVGKRANYYTFLDSSGARSGLGEQVFSQMESTSAPIVQKLLRGDLNLSGQERADLLFFMAFFATRVPLFRGHIEDFLGELGQRILLTCAQFEGNFVRQEVEEISQALLDRTEKPIRGSPPASLWLGIKAANDPIYPIFSEMKWVFLRSPVGHRFMTCDSPVSWVDPTPRPPFYAGHGLAMKNVEVTFPVGPRLSLLGTWEGPTGVIDVRPTTVWELNRRKIAFAHTEVYADSDQAARLALEIRQGIKDEGER